MKTLFFGAGQMDRIPPGAIVRTLCEATGVRREDFGNIAIKREFSFVDVREKAAADVLNQINHVMLDGRKVQVREYTARPGGKKPGRKKGKY